MQLPRSRPLGPWLVLGAALAAAAYLWAAAVETTSRSFQIIGHGSALEPGSVTTTTIDPLLVAVGFAMLLAGVGAAAWWTSRRGGSSAWHLKAALALTVAGAVATTVVAVRTPEAPGVALDSTESVIDAMGAAGLECVRTDLPGKTPAFAAEETRCLVPWSAAVARGSLAGVVIDIWKDEERRREWLAAPTQVGGAALLGPTWLVRCEFRSICSQLQTALDGRLVLAPPGEHYDLTSWRYYEKPFPISVEHAITGHYAPEEDGETP